MSELKQIVDEIVTDMAERTDRGKVASYIPELSCADPNSFGIAVAATNGIVASGGACRTPFSIQSISKVFTLALAIGKVGDKLWERVGREPSGSSFNSIIQLELECGIPRNPFINAGAIAVTDAILAGQQPAEALGGILRFIRLLSMDSSIYIDKAVADSEKLHHFRNSALANYMKSYGVIENPIEHVIGVYFHHCALAMSCEQLALAGRFLAFGGVDPATSEAILTPNKTRRVNAIMLTCGHYDGSGEFAYRVGLPGKSGVGGGILAIVPGHASIAVWSPGLDEAGNSHLGRIALEKLTQKMTWSIFG